MLIDFIGSPLNESNGINWICCNSDSDIVIQAAINHVDSFQLAGC